MPHRAGGSGFGQLYLAGGVGSLSPFIPFAFLVPAAVDHGVDGGDAALVLATAGAAYVAGRLLVPLVASQLGLLQSYRASVLALATSSAVWIAAGGSLPALTAFACLFGAACGAFVALSPAVAAELLGTAARRQLGALYTSAGIGALAGPPLAAAAIDATGGCETAITLTALAGLVGALALRSRPELPGGCGGYGQPNITELTTCVSPGGSGRVKVPRRRSLDEGRVRTLPCGPLDACLPRTRPPPRSMSRPRRQTHPSMKRIATLFGASKISKPCRLGQLVTFCLVSNRVPASGSCDGR